MPSHRRAFSLSPLIILLALVLLALIGWKVYISLDHIPANYPFASRVKGKIVTTNVVTALLLIAIAGGVGAACYFAFRKSEQAANIGMGLVLLLGVGTFSYQAYNYLVNGPGPQPAAATPTPQKSLADLARENEQQAQAAQEKMRAELNQMHERARAAAESASRPPAPAPFQPAPPTAPQVVPPGPTNTNPVPSPAPKPAAPRPKPENPVITQALAELKADLDKGIDALVTQAKALEDSVAKPPPRSMPVMDKRAADAKQLKSAAQALSKRLHALDTEVEKKLGDVGIEASDATHERIRFTIDYKANFRAFACNDYTRLCDDVAEESELLKRGFNNWKYDASGNVSSKDHQLEFQARSARRQIEIALKRSNDNARKLRGE